MATYHKISKKAFKESGAIILMPYKISARDLKIINDSLSGLSYAEISRANGITPSRVRSIVTKICREIIYHTRPQNISINDCRFLVDIRKNADFWLQNLK